MYKPLKLILAVALAAAPTTARAQLQARCMSDSLDPTQAAARLEWARKCGLLTNTNGTEDSFPYTNFIDTSFNSPQEYRELDASRAFSGNSDGYTVNYQFARNLYPASAFYNAVREASGPTTGFWKWSAWIRLSNGTFQQQPVRPRPLYPTFGPLNNTTTPWFPHPSLGTNPSSWSSIGCELYTDATGTTRATGGFWVASYCESSCYTPDQSLRFSNGDVNILEALQARRDDLVTLSPDATLDAVSTRVDKVLNYTAEIRDAVNPIVKITTASGGSLSVTTEHPVLTSKGRLVKAETLTVHDELLLADGTPDPITHVEKGTHFGKVYNLKPMSPEPVANILVAQGFLVGSARFQNDDVGYMNRILLFRAVPSEVLPR